jgi:hypothetical protein
MTGQRERRDRKDQTERAAISHETPTLAEGEHRRYCYKLGPSKQKALSSERLSSFGRDAIGYLAGALVG